MQRGKTRFTSWCGGPRDAPGAPRVPTMGLAEVWHSGFRGGATGGCQPPGLVEMDIILFVGRERFRFAGDHHHIHQLGEIILQTRIPRVVVQPGGERRQQIAWRRVRGRAQMGMEHGQDDGGREAIIAGDERDHCRVIGVQPTRGDALRGGGALRGECPHHGGQLRAPDTVEIGALRHISRDEPAERRVFVCAVRVGNPGLFRRRGDHRSGERLRRLALRADLCKGVFRDGRLVAEPAGAVGEFGALADPLAPGLPPRVIERIPPGGGNRGDPAVRGRRGVGGIDRLLPRRPTVEEGQKHRLRVDRADLLSGHPGFPVALRRAEIDRLSMAAAGFGGNAVGEPDRGGRVHRRIAGQVGPGTAAKDHQFLAAPPGAGENSPDAASGSRCHSAPRGTASPTG